MKKFLLILIFFSGIALILPAKVKAGHVGGPSASCPPGTVSERTYGECCGCGKAKEVAACTDASGKESFYWGDCVHQADSCTNGCATPDKPKPTPDCPNEKDQMLNACVRVDCDGKNWMKVEKWCNTDGFSYEKPGRSTGVSCSGTTKKPNPGCSAPDDGAKPAESCPGDCLSEDSCPLGAVVASPAGGWTESACRPPNVCCLAYSCSGGGGHCVPRANCPAGSGKAGWWTDCDANSASSPMSCCAVAAPTQKVSCSTFGGNCTAVSSCPLGAVVASPAGGWTESACRPPNVCCLAYSCSGGGGHCVPRANCPAGSGKAGWWTDCDANSASSPMSCCAVAALTPEEYGTCKQNDLKSDTYRECAASAESCPGRVVATNVPWVDCEDNMQTCCEVPKQPLKELGESCKNGTECQGYMEASIDCIGGKCRQVFTLEDCGVPRQDDKHIYECDKEAGYIEKDGYCCPGQENCKQRCEGGANQKKTCKELCGGEGGECLASDRGYRLENNSCVNDVDAVEPTSDCTGGKSCYCQVSVPCAGIDQSNNPDCKKICVGSQTTAAEIKPSIDIILSTISGHGEADSPAKNAKITLKDPDGKKFVVKTDENGDYTITVPTDRIYDVAIESSGYKTLAFKWDSKMGLDYLMNFKLVEKDKPENGNFEIEEATKDRLVVGWNLISLPVKPKKQMKASELLAEINRSGGLVVSVSRWQDGRWETYLAGLDKNDFTIEVGRAYFVENFNEAQFKIEGEEITQPQTLDLKPGWNAVGLPKTASCPANSCSAKVVMNLIDKQSADSARIFGQFESGLWGTLAKEGQQFYGWDFIIKSNAGYFVKVNKPIQLLP